MKCTIKITFLSMLGLIFCNFMMAKDQAELALQIFEESDAVEMNEMTRAVSLVPPAKPLSPSVVQRTIAQLMQYSSLVGFGKTDPKGKRVNAAQSDVAKPTRSLKAPSAPNAPASVTSSTTNPKITPVGFPLTVANYLETTGEEATPGATAAVGQVQMIYASQTGGRIRSFGSASAVMPGLPDFILDLTADQFFSPISTGLDINFVSVDYDAIYNLFFIVGSAKSTDTYNGLLLLAWATDVSSTGIITGITQTTIWNFAVVDAASNTVTLSGTDSAGNANFNAVIPAFYPYTSVASDGVNLYITSGVSDWTNLLYASSAAYVLPLSSLVATAPQVFPFRNLTENFIVNQNMGIFGPRVVKNFDASTGTGYIASTSFADELSGTSEDALGFGRIYLQQITLAQGATTATITAPLSVTAVPGFHFPISATVFGVAPTNNSGVTPPAAPRLINNLSTGDFQLSLGHIRNGLLYLVHEIGVDKTGSSLPSAITADRNAARVYQIQGLPAAPSALNVMTLYDPTPTTTPLSYFSPTITSGFGVVAGAITGYSVLVSATQGSATSSLNAVYAYAVSGNAVSNSPLTPATFLSQPGTGYYPTDDWSYDPQISWAVASISAASPATTTPSTTTMYPVAAYVYANNVWGVGVEAVTAPIPPASKTSPVPTGNKTRPVVGSKTSSLPTGNKTSKVNK